MTDTFSERSTPIIEPQHPLVREEQDAHQRLMKLANEFPSRHSTLTDMGEAILRVYRINKHLKALGITWRDE